MMGEVQGVGSSRDTITYLCYNPLVEPRFSGSAGGLFGFRGDGERYSKFTGSGRSKRMEIDRYGSRKDLEAMVSPLDRSVW